MMIIKNMKASIQCTDCDYSFTYSASLANCRLEKAYHEFFKRRVGSCPHCQTGKLIIVNAEYGIKPSKQKYTARWVCNICGQTWHQIERFKVGDPCLKDLLKQFTNNTETRCPACAANSKKLIGMSRQ